MGDNDVTTEVATLLNEAHTASDVTQKLNSLSRVREVLFQRDTSGGKALDEMMSQIMDFQVQAPAPIARFLLSFSEASLTRSPKFYQHFFTLVTDVISNDDVSPKIFKKYVGASRRTLRRALGHLLIKDKKYVEADTHIWSAIERNIICLKSIVENTAMVDSPERQMYAIKFLELVVLTFADASDNEYRDSSRSNVFPDEVNIQTFPISHPVLQRETLLSMGEDIVALLCKRLVSAVQVLSEEKEYDSFRVTSVLLNTLVLIASLRPGVVNTIVPALLSLEFKSRTLKGQKYWRVIRSSLRGNLLHLLRLPSLRHHADAVRKVLVDVMGASDQASSAVAKAREPRRKYASSGKVNIKKSATEKLMNVAAAVTATPAKRKRRMSVGEVTPENAIFAMPKENLVELVMNSMKNKMSAKGRKKSKKNLKQLLQLLAVPADVSAKKPRNTEEDQMNVETAVSPAVSPNDIESIVEQMEHKNARVVVQSAVKSKAKDEASCLVQVTSENKVVVQPLKPLSEDTSRMLAQQSLLRVLETERGADICGKASFREQLVARLASNRWIVSKASSSSNETALPEPYPSLIKFIGDNYQRRISLGVALLYREYALQESYVEESIYEKLAHGILACVHSKMDLSTPADKTLFRQFIHKLPYISLKVLQLICSCFDAPQGINLGILTLRDLVTDRPTNCSHAALFVLLYYTTHSNVDYRNPTLRCVANQLYAKEDLRHLIESYAQKQLNLLVGGDSTMEVEGGPAVADIKDNEILLSGVSSAAQAQYTQWKSADLKNEDLLLKFAKNLNAKHEEEEEEASEFTSPEQVLQNLEMFLALCAKNIELFKQLILVYGKTSNEVVRDTIYSSLSKLVISLKGREGEAALVRQLCGFHFNALSLVCHIIEICCQQMRPSEVLLESVLSLYYKTVDDMEQGSEEEAVNKNQVASLVIPVLSGISRTALQPILPALLMLPEPRMEMAISKLLNIIPPPVEAGALLLDLHHVPIKEGDKELQKRVIQAINMCKDKPGLFNMEVFGVIVNELVDENPIPRLTLRTMILAVTLFPKLKPVMINLCEKLAMKNIWELKDKALWKGFSKCISILQPESFKALYPLPEDQLSYVLTQEKIRDTFVSYVSSDLEIYEAAPAAIKTKYEIPVPEKKEEEEEKTEE